MKTLSRSINILVLLVLVASLVAVVSAQDFRGKVQGLVTDPSQAAIASATVTLKNINTGVETVRQTDASGHYLVDYVQPGNYSVSVQAAGFQRAVQENVTVMTPGT